MNDKFGWTRNEYISVKNFSDNNTFFANSVERRLSKNDSISGFQQEVIEKLNDKEFQAAARQRYKTLAGIINGKSTGKHFERNQFGYIVSVNEDRSMSKEESVEYYRKLCEETPDSELPTQRAGKTIKELTQEVQYDLEREHDVNKREELILRCARYIRLENMSKSLEGLE